MSASSPDARPSGCPPAPLPGPARLLLASGAVSGLGVAALSFCLPLASYYRASPELFAGSAFALFFLARLAASSLAGTLSRLAGPERLIMGALALGAVAPLVYAASPTLAALAVAQGLLGLSSGLMRPALASLAAGGATDRSRLFSLFGVAANAAFFAGPVIGGLLFLDRNASNVLLFVSLTHLAAMALAWKAGKVTAPPVELGNSKQAVSPPGLDEPDEPSSASLPRVLAAVFGRTAGAGAWAAFFPILLASRLSGDPLLFGLLAGLPALSACLLTMPFARFLASRSRTHLTLAGMLLSALALAAAPAAGSTAAMAIFALILGAGTAVSLPAAMALAAGRDVAVGRMGLAQAAAGAGFVMGPLAGALLVRWSGGAGSALAALGAFGAICCLPLALTLLRDPRFSRRAWMALAAIAAVVLLPLAAGTGGRLPPPEKGLHRFTGVAMGTELNLTVETESPRLAEKASQAAFEVIRDLQADLDFRSPDGSIGRVNHEAGRRPVEVSAFAFGLIERSLKICADTGGELDITIGAISTRPLYYASLGNASREMVDYRLVRLDPAARTVYLPKKGMALDLGAVAKGAILDKALEAALATGVKAALVEGGGDFACAGDREWRVAVEHPRNEGVLGVMRIRQGGVCGSGDYRRSVADPADSSRRLHHIIDPSTMRPAQASIGVTAVAPNAELADALATALFILGPEAGKKLLAGKYPDVQAQWMLPDLTVTASPGFPKLTPPPDATLKK